MSLILGLGTSVKTFAGFLVIMLS